MLDKGERMYTVKRFETSIPVAEYLEGFVDIPTFLEACKACPNYNQVWSCPPYAFDVEEYWKKYEKLELLAAQILFEEAYTERLYTKEELEGILQQVLPVEKQRLTEELMEREKESSGSISLSAGSCQQCREGCTKPEGKPCRFPDKMRYSLESLGGNVGLTLQKLFGIELEWMEEGKLPHHFVLVMGLLIP